MTLKNFLFITKKDLFLKYILNFLFFLFPIIFFFSHAVATTFSLIFCIYSVFFFHYSNLKIIFDILDKILLIFFLIVICSGILNKNLTIINIIKEIGIIRFFLVYVLIKNILKYNLIKVKTFFLVAFLCTFFLSLNILLIHLIGSDIFFNTEHNTNIIGHQRYSSFFDDRHIAGSYLFNFFFFSLFFFYFNKKYSDLLIFLSILYFGIAILLTFDRTPFILFILSIITINFLNIKKNFFFKSIIILSVPILIIFIYPKANARYGELNNFFNEVKNYNKKMLLKEQIIKNDPDQTIELLNKLGEHNYYSYFSIYIDGISYIMYENTFFGSGKSTFFIRCSNYRKNNDPMSLRFGYTNACPAHSHNLFIQIGLESGVVGLVIFSFFLVIKIINLTKIFINFKNKESYKFFYFILLFTCLLIEVFPFRPFGKLLNTYNGFLFFFKIAFIYALTKKEFKLN